MLKSIFFFKFQIKQELEKNGINIYPLIELEEEPDDVISNNKIRVTIYEYLLNDIHYV